MSEDEIARLLHENESLIFSDSEEEEEDELDDDWNEEEDRVHTYTTTTTTQGSHPFDEIIANAHRDDPPTRRAISQPTQNENNRSVRERGRGRGRGRGRRRGRGRPHGSNSSQGNIICYSIIFYFVFTV